MHLDDVQLWQRVITDVDLVEAAARATALPADLARLRTRWDADMVRVALELAEARRRATRKFGATTRLVADRAGVEQATSARVATHKAQRWRGADAVADLCSGIGGDAMGLATVTSVTAVDRRPVRAWMAAINAGCRSIVGDVDKVSTDCASFHIDPARRDEHTGRRAWTVEGLEPGLDTIAALATRFTGGAVKLGPGIPPDLPLLASAETEYISEDGGLVQAVAWLGNLAQGPGTVRATAIGPGHRERTLQGDRTPLDEGTAAADAPSGVLLVPDAALERAGLVETERRRLGARGLHPGLGLLTAPSDFDPRNAPWFGAFTIIATCSWRERALRRALAQHDAGRVTVRTRGRAVDPDAWAPRLSRSGARPIVLFALRLGHRIVAILTTTCIDAKP